MTSQPPILIGYDGSEAAKHAVREAATALPGRRTIVLHVFEESVMPGLAQLEALAKRQLEIPDLVLEEINTSLESMALERAAEGATRATSLGLDADHRVERFPHRSFEATSGQVAERICAVAEELAASFVVLASGGVVSPTGLLRLGSVAYRTLHDCSRPVLLVPRR